MTLLSYLYASLKQHLTTNKPLLLGYSGGVDSQALFHLLLEVKKKHPFDLHVVHVDHAFRKQSTTEALRLQNYVKSFNIPFHLCTLDPFEKETVSSIENYLREKRYHAFVSVYHSIEAHALILAHHQQDQEQTIFKRLFEGASFFKLCGLKEMSRLWGMQVLRPLLNRSKEELFAFLQKQKIFHIEDETNQDLNYLRNRQRLQLFPYIEKTFGKKCLNHLIKLKNTVQDFEEYLLLKNNFDSIFIKGPFGIMASLIDLGNLHKIEMEYLLRKLLNEAGITPSFTQLEILKDLIKDKKRGKKVLFSTAYCMIENDSFFFIHNKEAQYFDREITPEDLPLTFETQDYIWKIEPFSNLCDKLDSHNTWQGVINYQLKKKKFALQSLNPTLRVNEKTLKERWKEARLPYFLLNQLPALCQDDTLSCPWIKIPNSLKEEEGVRVHCRAKNSAEGDLYGLKSIPLVSSES